jgi:hypothetical protein
MREQAPKPFSLEDGTTSCNMPNRNQSIGIVPVAASELFTEWFRSTVPKTFCCQRIGNIQTAHPFLLVAFCLAFSVRSFSYG